MKAKQGRDLNFEPATLKVLVCRLHVDLYSFLLDGMILALVFYVIILEQIVLRLMMRVTIKDFSLFAWP